MTSPDVREACRQALENLRRTFGDRLVALALYGSAARAGRGFGDLDFYAIARDLPDDLRERDRLVDRALGDLDPPLRRSILAKTPEEFDADVTPLMLDLALDAQVLWDPTGYLVLRLSRLREILREARLEREAHDHGFLWVFRDPPSGPWELNWQGYREVGHRS
jgi:predicted nucleotidyltransferase